MAQMYFPKIWIEIYLNLKRENEVFTKTRGLGEIWGILDKDLNVARSGFRRGATSPTPPPYEPYKMWCNQIRTFQKLTFHDRTSRSFQNYEIISCSEVIAVWKVSSFYESLGDLLGNSP